MVECASVSPSHKYISFNMYSFFSRQVFAPSSHAKAIQVRRCSGSLTMVQRLNAQHITTRLYQATSPMKLRHLMNPMDPMNLTDPVNPRSLSP